MRILITGAGGQLGHELQRVLSDETLILKDHPKFDLLSPDAHDRVYSARPDIVIHTAGITDVDAAELQPELAMAVNVEGTNRVARATAAVRGRLIYISTDYVFDGRKTFPYCENDEPNPINVYGRSKCEGERVALAGCPNTLVVRTSWLYGVHGKNFVKTIMRQASEKPELRIVSDQRGCPTHAGELASTLRRVLSLDLTGIVHAAGSGECSWHELACEIVALSGAAAKVVPIRSAEAGRHAARPAYSVLGNHVLARYGIVLPHWKESLTRFMRDRQAVTSAKS